MAQRIDHTVADFNRDTLLRGYYCQAVPFTDILIYGATVTGTKKGNSCDVHIIIHDYDGFWEYTVSVTPFGSLEHYINGLAENLGSDRGKSWYDGSYDT